MTKIDIISGFLGAGKTTLIKKLIEQAFKGEKLVLIENEFGEIGIDGGFLKDAGVQITEMNSGCICCSLVGDFGTALKQVITDYTPDRIIIEPSGVGKLSDVIKAVKDVSGNLDVELDSYTTVADVSKVKIYMKNFGEFFNNQIESANTIILSRTQTTTQDKIEKAVAMIREKNDHATIITTPWDEIKGEQILKVVEGQDSLEVKLLAEQHAKEEALEHEHEHHHDHDHEEHDENCTCGCHDHHHHHHADEVFTSWGKETPHKYNEDKLREILDTLADTEKYGVILRAKGIVPSDAGEWLYFDLVPGEFEIRKGKADITGKLCVIGSKLKEDDLAELFEV